MVCTGILRGAVEDVGKPGQVAAIGGQFSKSPELHRRVLENCHPKQTKAVQQDATDFHFSHVNYG